MHMLLERGDMVHCNDIVRLDKNIEKVEILVEVVRKRKNILMCVFEMI